jgi:hypothetical protein
MPRNVATFGTGPVFAASSAPGFRFLAPLAVNNTGSLFGRASGAGGNSFENFLKIACRSTGSIFGGSVLRSGGQGRVSSVQHSFGFGVFFSSLPFFFSPHVS